MTFRDWAPVWSKPAFLRAIRATIVVPGLFAIAYEVIGNLQMATFAAFGGFATLVLASFGGSRRDKLIAHLGLALVGHFGFVLGYYGAARFFSPDADQVPSLGAHLLLVPIGMTIQAGIPLPGGIGGTEAAFGGPW